MQPGNVDEQINLINITHLPKLPNELKQTKNLLLIQVILYLLILVINIRQKKRYFSKSLYLKILLKIYLLNMNLMKKIFMKIL